jgi:LPXTG-motif cell wall-anchored protein
MSTVYESTVDSLREVGERLAHEMPSALGSVRVPSVRIASSIPANMANMADVVHDWPDDLIDRVTGRSRSRRRQTWLAAGGAVILVLAAVWFVRRRRTDDAVQAPDVADSSRASGAA